MLRAILMLVAVYIVCCAAAYGQTAPGSVGRPGAPARGAVDRNAPQAGGLPVGAPGAASGGAAGRVEMPDLSPAEAMRRSKGSMLRATLMTAPQAERVTLKDVSLYAVPVPEPRTLKKHDLVTIIVREESESKSEGKTDLKREMALQAKLEEFVKLKLRNFEIEGGGVGPTPPGVKMDASRDTKNEATVDRTDSLTARVTAEVLDVKPNGTLVLQARKRIKADEEEQEMILSGICRAEDVQVDNTVLSTQLYDLVLEKNHKGAVKDTMQRGWLGKLLDVLNPL